MNSTECFRHSQPGSLCTVVIAVLIEVADHLAQLRLLRAEQQGLLQEFTAAAAGGIRMYQVRSLGLAARVDMMGPREMHVQVVELRPDHLRMNSRDYLGNPHAQL